MLTIVVRRFDNAVDGDRHSFDTDAARINRNASSCWRELRHVKRPTSAAAGRQCDFAVSHVELGQFWRS